MGRKMKKAMAPQGAFFHELIPVFFPYVNDYGHKTQQRLSRL